MCGHFFRTSSQVNRGVQLLNHIFFENIKQGHTCFLLREKELDYVLSDMLQIHFFGVLKYSDTEPFSDRLKKGSFFFKHTGNSEGITVHFHKENLTFNNQTSPMQNLMFQLMGAFAEFERTIIRDNQPMPWAGI